MDFFNNFKSKLYFSKKKFFYFFIFLFFSILLFVSFFFYKDRIIDPFNGENEFKNYFKFFYLIFNLKFIVDLLFFSYGFAAWIIPISLFLISIFILFSNSKIKLFFRLFSLLQFPIFFSFLYSVFSIKKNIFFKAGGFIGNYFNLLIGINSIFYLKIWGFILLIFFLQEEGFILIKNIFYFFLKKSGLIEIFYFGKNFIISGFYYFFPFLKKLFPKNYNSLFEDSLRESINEEIYEINEYFNLELLNEKIEVKNSFPFEIIPAKNVKKKEINNEFEEKSFEIISIAKSFGFDLKFINFYKGPMVITSIFELSLNDRISKLFPLEIEFGRLLGKSDLKIIYPMKEYPSCIGFQYSLSNKKIVNFMDYAHDEKFLKDEGKISFLFGVDTKGDLKIYDLSIMPHLLVAGASGSGKSTFMHCCISSILWKYKSDYCKIILIDPKKVEYNYYFDVNHLLFPIATNIEEILNILNYVFAEMNKRYDIFSKLKVKNIIEYNNLSNEKEKIPYIAIFIDEYADISSQSKDAENIILRIIQMGRAAGIHFVIATQRPSVDIITGVIKANMPFKIAFKVASSIDSRVILGIDGAQDLLGNGDMMIIDNSGNLERIFGAYLNIIDIENITSTLKKINFCKNKN